MSEPQNVPPLKEWAKEHGLEGWPEAALVYVWAHDVAPDSETAHRLADHYRAGLPLGHESVPVIT